MDVPVRLRAREWFERNLRPSSAVRPVAAAWDRALAVPALRALRGVPRRAFFFAAATLLTGGWAADGLKGEALFAEWVPALEAFRLPIALLAVGAFAGSALGLFHERRAFLAVRTLVQRPAEPHRALVLVLSPPGRQVEAGPGGLRVGGVDIAADTIPEAVRALDEAGLRWSWQQLLRGLEPHQETLRLVHLIGSPGPEGSHVALDAAEAVVRRFLPGVEVLREPEPVDFDELDVLVRGLARGVEALRARGLDESEIVIDVTGGKKTTSIAGAIVTLNSGVTFQYVDTSPPHRVWRYDLAIESRALV